jgi:hypothetical protein
VYLPLPSFSIRMSSCFQFRLRRSRIRNVIYLVERLAPLPFRGLANHLSYGVEKFGRGRFLAALLSTQILHQFFLKWTDSFRESLAYIVSLTRHLTKKYMVIMDVLRHGVHLTLDWTRRGT